jgi:hypothetical protein
MDSVATRSSRIISNPWTRNISTIICYMKRPLGWDYLDLTMTMDDLSLYSAYVSSTHIWTAWLLPLNFYYVILGTLFWRTVGKEGGTFAVCRFWEAWFACFLLTFCPDRPSGVSMLYMSPRMCYEFSLCRFSPLFIHFIGWTASIFSRL